MLLSVCIPVYNGAKTIGPLLEEVRRVVTEIELEFVLVNDGSKDNSEAVCAALAETYDEVKFISLRRNFGEHNAVMCALNYCSGDYAVVIDDDFQNPPSEILSLLREAVSGRDVVYSKYHVKKHNLFRNLGSKFNDLMATWLLRKPKGLYLSSFKVIARPVIDEIIKYKGPFPYIDGLILRVTDNFSSVYVEHSARAEGRSNYTLGKLISLWLNMFINFSIRPLRVMSFTGFFTSLISLILGISFIVEKVRNPRTPLGWASLAVIVLFFGGVQLIFLGLLGEYVGKHYLEANGTPQWVVKKEYL